MRAATRPFRRALVVLPFIVTLAGVALAPVAAAQPQPEQPAPELLPPCAPPADAAVPRVTAAARAAAADESGDRGSPGGVVELGDTIAVKVSGLATLVAQEQCWRTIDSEARIVLYLDRRPLPDAKPTTGLGPGGDELRFDLRRTAESKPIWAHLLGSPRLDPREIEVSVGIDGRFAIPTSARIALRPLPRRQLLFWLILFLGLVAGFFVLARQSEILRDAVGEPGPDKRRPYSLARVQAAWWFFLILAAYLFLGIVTGDFSDTITGSVLVLLGLSAGTALGSAVIDVSKDTPAARQATAAAIDRLTRQLDAQPAQPSAVKETLRSQLCRLRNENEQFVRDILSDASGVCFHRFQIAAWTLVLGLVFVFEVYRQLAMPQLSETLLSLMGISAGTYLGMKIPEDTVPQPTGQPD